MNSLSIEDLQNELKELAGAEQEAYDVLQRVAGGRALCEKLLQDLLARASVDPES